MLELDNLDVEGNISVAGNISASNINPGSTVTGNNSGDQTIVLSGAVSGNGTSSIVTIYAGVVPVIKGGTQSIAPLSNNRVMKSASGSIVEASAITPSRALISDANGIPTQSVVTSTELSQLSAVSATSIQTQIDGKQPSDATLSALAAFDSNGLLTQTSHDNFVSRSIVPGSSKVIIQNITGVSGNPSIDIVEAFLQHNNIAGTVNILHGGTGQSTAIAGKDALTTQGTDIASSSTTDLSTATGEFVNITGTTTITSFGTVSAGATRVLKFASALIITHNATSLILPGSANITTVAGDIGTFRSLGSGNWICIDYSRFSGVKINTGQANTYGDFDQSFRSSRLIISNPANTFFYTLVGAAITAARNLNLPLTTQTETFAVQPTIIQSSPANPTGTTSTTGVMMGLAVAFTPVITGRVKITILGDVNNATNGRGSTMQIYTGTGTAPTNGAALTGTAQGINQNMFSNSSNQRYPFTLVSTVTGLSISTAIWVDLALASVTGGTSLVRTVMVIIEEF